jgi:hypothetical protein
VFANREQAKQFSPYLEYVPAVDYEAGAGNDACHVILYMAHTRFLSYE